MKSKISSLTKRICTKLNDPSTLNGNLNGNSNRYRYRYRPNKTTSELPKPIRVRPSRHRPVPFIEELKSLNNIDESSLSLFHHYEQTGFKHDYPSYASLIYKLARGGHFQPVASLLRELRVRRIRCKESLFAGLFLHYGKVNMVDEAVELFRGMKRFNVQRSIHSFNTLLNVFVYNGRDELVDEFVKGSKEMGLRLNVVSFDMVIKMWLGKGELEKARNVFVQMTERGIEPSVVSYNSVIMFLCRRGEVEEARGLLKDMRRRRVKANHVTFGFLMEGYCVVGKFEEAKKLMFDMEYQDCTPTTNNYGVLITDLVKRGLIDEAKDLVDEMKERHIRPDVGIYNILINWFVNNGRPGEAYRVLVEMQTLGRDLKPHAVTYRMVIDGFCKTGEYQEALKVFNVMLGSRDVPLEDTLCSLVKGLIKNGQVEDAYFVLMEMGKRKLIPDVESWEALVAVSIATNSK